MNKNANINRIIQQMDENNQNNSPEFNQVLDKIHQNHDLMYNNQNKNQHYENTSDKDFKGSFQISENFPKNDNKSITEYMRKPTYRKDVFNTNDYNEEEQNKKFSTYMDNFNIKKKKK